MQDYKHFAGTRFMIRGTHPWAGWVGSYVEFRRLSSGRVHVLELESANPLQRKEVFILELGHVRRAADHEIGDGGKP
jgi:hypothetical protein